MSPSVTIPFSNKEVENLVMWRNPKQTGLIVGGASLAYFLLSSGTSTSFVVSVLVLAVVAIATLWGQTGSLFKSAGPPVPLILVNGISEADLLSIRQPLNKALGVVGVVLSGKDLKLSGVICGVLLVAVYVFRFISFITLSYTGLMLAFTIPKAYELNKEKVDKVMANLQHKSKEVYGQFEDKVRSTIPSQKKAT